MPFQFFFKNIQELASEFIELFDLMSFDDCADSIFLTDKVCADTKLRTPPPAPTRQVLDLRRCVSLKYAETAKG